jgi:hypothetical protein
MCHESEEHSNAGCVDRETGRGGDFFAACCLVQWQRAHIPSEHAQEGTKENSQRCHHCASSSPLSLCCCEAGMRRFSRVCPSSLRSAVPCGCTDRTHCTATTTQHTLKPTIPRCIWLSVYPLPRVCGIPTVAPLQQQRTRISPSPRKSTVHSLMSIAG